MEAQGSIRVLVADDSPTALKSVCDYLEFAGGFEVVGKAKDGRTAVQRAVETKPDLALLDLSMPRLNGLEAARQIRGELRDIRILIFSELEGLSLGDECRRNGADGFVSKNLLPEGLLMEIQRLFRPTGVRESASSSEPS